MPSQDLLFPILPRAPAAPGSEEIKREVNQISKKHQKKKHPQKKQRRKNQPRLNKMHLLIIP